MPLSRYSLIATFSLTMICGCLPATRSTIGVPREGVRGDAGERLAEAYSTDAISPDRRALLQHAESWLGVPYYYGGNSRTGVDCSGFVCQVFGAIERRLPRTSREQSLIGEPIALSEAQPGDLVFFNTTGSGVSHVGILINGDEFIHASTSNGVIVSSLGERYYRDRMVSVRRVITDMLVGTR